MRKCRADFTYLFTSTHLSACKISSYLISINLFRSIPHFIFLFLSFQSLCICLSISIIAILNIFSALLVYRQYACLTSCQSIYLPCSYSETGPCLSTFSSNPSNVKFSTYYHPVYFATLTPGREICSISVICKYNYLLNWFLINEINTEWRCANKINRSWVYSCWPKTSGSSSKL